MSNARGPLPSLRPLGLRGSMYSCGLTKHVHYLVHTVFGSHCRDTDFILQARGRRFETCTAHQ